MQVRGYQCKNPQGILFLLNPPITCNWFWFVLANPASAPKITHCRWVAASLQSKLPSLHKVQIHNNLLTKFSRRQLSHISKRTGVLLFKMQQSLNKTKLLNDTFGMHHTSLLLVYQIHETLQDFYQHPYNLKFNQKVNQELILIICNTHLLLWSMNYISNIKLNERRNIFYQPNLSLLGGSHKTSKQSMPQKHIFLHKTGLIPLNIHHTSSLQAD